jgi:hypothetical protein
VEEALMEIPMAIVGAILAGIALAACAGIRAFLPLLGMGIAARAGVWPGDAPAYVASNTWLIVFGCATVVEVLADKIPVVDHLLDMLQTVIRPLAGAMLIFPAFSQVMPPAYSAALALLTGAPLALGVHATKSAARVASTATTGGTANPVLSIIEDAVTAVLVVLAILAPFAAALLLVISMRWLWRRARRKPAAPASV